MLAVLSALFSAMNVMVVTGCNVSDIMVVVKT